MIGRLRNVREFPIGGNDWVAPVSGFILGIPLFRYQPKYIADPFADQI